VFRENATSITLEAENATLAGPKVLTNHGGYTGTGFADYQNNSNDYIEWNATVANAGPYTLTFRYALGTSARNLAIRVNGTVVSSNLSFPRTTNWATWNTISISANLVSGVNRIRATATGNSGPNMDNLKIAPGSPAIASRSLNENGAALLFPNPASNFLYINLAAKKGEIIKLNLINTMGQKVKDFNYQAETDGVNTISLDIQRLKDGPYYIRISTGNSITTKKAYINQ
jgi:hypothetical protein